jgi:hypothetical protein
MPKPLKVGLIGCGGIMRGAHLNPGWLAVPDVELVAACDVHEAGAKKLAADFKVPKVFTDFNDLLKIKEIDLVDICTPNKVHTSSPRSRPASTSSAKNRSLSRSRKSSPSARRCVRPTACS